MIFESSKCYGTGKILMHYDGKTPTEQEVRQHVERHYGAKGGTVLIHEASEYRGFHNPGTVLFLPSK